MIFVAFSGSRDWILEKTVFVATDESMAAMVVGCDSSSLVNTASVTSPSVEERGGETEERF